MRSRNAAFRGRSAWTRYIERLFDHHLILVVYKVLYRREMWLLVN